MEDTFYYQARTSLLQQIQKHHYTTDQLLVETVAKEFATLHHKWDSGVFELRQEQILFSYLCAYDTIHQKQTPLALGLGCGEGKQEAFAIALKSSYTILKNLHKHPKLLFLTASSELVMQMRNSLPLKDFKNITLLKSQSQLSQADKEGVYLCDFDLFLSASLDKKNKKEVKLFNDITKIYIDEFHAFLAMSDYITAKYTIDERPMHQDRAKKDMQKLIAYKQILKDTEKLNQRYNLIRPSDTRYKVVFNFEGIKKDGVLLEEYLYNYYKNQPNNPLNILSITKREDFFSLLDDITQALSYELGRDYYLFKEDECISSYCTAQEGSAKPLEGTTFNNRNISLFVLLKHCEHFYNPAYKKEFEVLQEVLNKQTTSSISPIESMQLLDTKHFIAASATLKALKQQQMALMMKSIYLQEEVFLSLEDENVHISIDNHSQNFQDIISLIQNAPQEQILITSSSQKTLQNLHKAIKPHTNRELVCIYRDTINPNEQTYNAKLNSLKELIALKPLTKRVLFIQGIGEGSNILKTTHSDYEAIVIALDIEAIDKVTQKRYRVGTKGRVQGRFEHRVDFSSSALTNQELQLLKATTNQAQLLNTIEHSILKEIDTSRVKRTKEVNRRDFIKKAAVAATVLTTLPSQLIEFFNNTFDTNLQTNELYAKDYKIPPGIAMARDPIIKRAYIEIEYGKGYGFRYESNVNYAASMLGLTRAIIGGGPVVNSKTPLIEPAYWYLITRYHLGGDKDPAPDKEFEEKNPSLYHFSYGIGRYIGKYINKRTDIYDYNGKIEKSFLNSIFIAAGKTEKDVEQYRKLPFNKKEEKIKEIIKIFETYKPDPSKYEINDDYDKLLTAQWSAMWLTVHYDNISFKKTGDLTYYIEKKLRKKINLKIRGPPYYPLK